MGQQPGTEGEGLVHKTSPLTVLSRVYSPATKILFRQPPDGKQDFNVMFDGLLWDSIWCFEDQTGELLNASQMSLVTGLLNRIEQRDPDLAMHSHRVTGLSMRLARYMGLSPEEVQIIRWAGLMHDVGKLQIPDAILNKQAPLSADEWTIVHRHPAEGAEMVRELIGITDVAGLIMTHHERYDGHGYPCRLSGEKIPLGSRILALADSYCAMTDERVYKRSLSPQAAYTEVLRCISTDFDPLVVQAFTRLAE